MSLQTIEQDDTPVRFPPPSAGPWTPKRGRTWLALGWLIGAFMGWQWGLPEYKPTPPAIYWGTDPLKMDVNRLIHRIHNHGVLTMKQQQLSPTEQLDRLLPPLAAEEVRQSDKLTELERELEWRRQYYPTLAKRGKLKASEAYSRIAIMKAILADYQAQEKAEASYRETAARLGEKE